MKMNVRKWLSAVLAVTLVAVMLPLGAMPVAADSMSVTTNLVTNGDFAYPEIGDPTYWHGGTFGTAYGYDGTKGAQVTGGNMYQIVAVDQGCSYLLTFRAKVVSGEKFMVRVTGGDVYLEETCTNTDWALYSFIVSVSGADEYATLSFVAAADASVYGDDEMLVLSGAAEKTVLKNGSFETGNASGWSLGNTASVSDSLPHSGLYSLYATPNTGAYSYAATQTVSVEQNANYTISFWYSYASSVSPDMRLYVHDGDKEKTNIMAANNNIQPVVYCRESTAVSGIWAMATLSFNSGANDTLFLKFGGGSGGFGEIYLDDFTMIKVGDTSGSETPEVTNLITNSTFETGAIAPWAKFGTSSAVPTVVSDYVHTGNYSLRVPFSVRQLSCGQDVTVEANTNYIVSFYYMSTDASAGKNMWFGAYTTDTTSCISNKNDIALDPVVLDYTQSEWTLATYSFNSGDNTTVRLSFSGTSSSNPSNRYFIRVDDIVMVKQFTSFPEESIKGNFYSCNKQYTTIVPEQTYATAAEGKTYRITFSARAMTNGFRLYVNQRTENGANVSDYTKFWSEDARGWTDISIICRSTTDELNLKVVNLGNGTLETNLYITDFVVTEIPDKEENIFIDTKKSAMEMNPALTGETAGRGGLAFLYTVDMSGAQVAAGNSSFDNSTGLVYQSESAIAHPYTNDLFNDPYDYKVVEVGAIVSLVHNNADDLTIENVTTDNKTIRIKGEKRWEVGENFYKYAVRVRNIPTHHFGTTVYIRPYAIVKTLNGTRQVTLYGDMQQSSYNQAVEEAAQ